MDEQKPFLVAAIVFSLLTLALFTMCLVLSSCTVSMTMNHSKSGTSTDLDEDQTTAPNTSASIPVNVTPSISGAK